MSSKVKVPINTELDIDMQGIRDSVSNRLSKEIMKSLYGRYAIANGQALSDEYAKIVKECTTDLLEANKDVIIEETIKRLTDRLSRAKEVRDKLAVVVADFTRS